MDFDDKNLGQLIQASKDAISRTRYVFLAINIAGLILTAEVFNTHFLRIQNTAARPEKRMKELRDDYTEKHGLYSITNAEYISTLMELSNSLPDSQTLVEIRKVELAELWTVSMPIIGVKFSVWDMPILGAIGMVVLTSWYLLSLRTQYLVINEIKIEAARQPTNTERLRYLYNSIAHHFVWSQLDSTSTSKSLQRKELIIVSKILQFMPAWSTLIATAFELYSLSQPTAAAHSGGQMSLWKTMFHQERIEVAVRLILCSVIGVYLLRICMKANEYHEKSLDAVEELRKKLNS